MKEACVILVFVEPLTNETLPQTVRKKTKAVAKRELLFTSEKPERSKDVTAAEASIFICGERCCVVVSDRVTRRLFGTNEPRLRVLRQFEVVGVTWEAKEGGTVGMKQDIVGRDWVWKILRKRCFLFFSEL